ncbi:hypothetical protein PHMEG_00033855, partial [Phytophthora megakarya]
MKRLFRAFPEVVLVYTTHGTNVNQYKLFSFAVTDFFGKGQYIQHALVKAETKDNLRLTIESFKSYNPTWSKIRVFITDKAFHEKAVLLEMFPKARQLLCLFHVVTWLERQAGRLSSGSQAHKEMLKAAITAIVYSNSETEYEQGKAYLLQLLGGHTDHELYQSFLNNWDANRREWVLFERGNVPHLRNHTNNRLESKWGKVKQVINKDDFIDDLISTLIFLQEVAEDKYLREYHRVGSCGVSHENPELAALAMNLSPFAFERVEEEFKYATGGRADYVVNIENGVVILESRRTGLKHTVNRKNLCETVLPPYNTIPERWMRGCSLNDIAVGHVGAGDVTHHTIQRSDRVKTLQEGDKYSKAKTKMEHIISLLYVQSTPTFRAAMGFLDGFARVLHEGKFADFAVGFTPGEVDVIKLESKEEEKQLHQFRNTKIEEAKAAIPYQVEDTNVYVAYWKDYGCITQGQLTVMERIIKIMLDITVTLDWVEAVTWNENDLQAVQYPFIDEHLISKGDRKGANMAMPLGTRFLGKEATFGASLL